MIRMVEDVVPQLAVAGADLLGEWTLPQWHRWLVYGITIAGYAGGAMNWGGPFLKEMGKASLPLSIRQLSETFRGGMTAKPSRTTFRSSRVASNAVSRSYEPEFKGVGVV